MTTVIAPLSADLMIISWFVTFALIESFASCSCADMLIRDGLWRCETFRSWSVFSWWTICSSSMSWFGGGRNVDGSLTMEESLCWLFLKWYFNLNLRAKSYRSSVNSWQSICCGVGQNDSPLHNSSISGGDKMVGLIFRTLVVPVCLGRVSGCGIESSLKN